MESGGRHDHHRHIHGSGDRERDNDFPVGEVEELAPVSIIMHCQPDLGEAGMEVDGMRHDGGADNAHGDRDRRCILELGNGVWNATAASPRGNEYLDQITKADDRDQSPMISSIV